LPEAEGSCWVGLWAVAAGQKVRLEWEQELNVLVYELYGLMNEEVRIVEKSVK